MGQVLQTLNNEFRDEKQELKDIKKKVCSGSFDVPIQRNFCAESSTNKKTSITAKAIFKFATRIRESFRIERRVGSKLIFCVVFSFKI